MSTLVIAHEHITDKIKIWFMLRLALIGDKQALLGPLNRLKDQL